VEALEKRNTLGRIAEINSIKSSLSPFRIMPEYITVYPEVVIKALGNLYIEYNKAFDPLVVMNREWDTDYQYCFNNGVPVNWCVQIDMVGLDDKSLDEAKHMSEEDVREILRKKIFEIENSIAVYQLLENFFAKNGNGSFFKTRYRVLLESIRQRFGMPIALLAVTQPKYDAMLASEFGKFSGENLTDQEVKELSGFDTFFGPKQFREYLAANNVQCGYLLYVRSSDPVDKLKKPEIVVDHPLLGDAEMRRTIKAHTLTLNIDAPGMSSDKRINDTKDYMPSIGMGFSVFSIKDLFSAHFNAYLSSLDLEDVTILRAKPIKGAYGCYGHIRGSLQQERFLNELAKNLVSRGPYIVQPEIEPPVASDSAGVEYVYIDRVFFGIINEHPAFIGGVRNLMPAESADARRGRIHGSRDAVYAEIIG